MGREEQELAILVTARDAASRVLKGVKGQVNALERAAAKGVRNAGRNIERAAVVGVIAAAGLGTAAVHMAMDWETAFAGVAKTVEATPAQLSAIEDGLRGMSRELPVAATDLAAIAETAGALGIATPDILSFTKTVALIGTTTNVSTDEAATALGQLQNVLGLTGDDFDNFGATLVDLGNKGASTEAQILEIGRRSGAAAKLFGIAKEQTLGWAAAAANLGMNEELAGTSLQNVFLKLMPKYVEGSKTLQKITGQTGAQIKKSFKDDAGGALEFLVQKLGDLPEDQRLAAVQKLFGKGSGITRLMLGLADSVDKNLTPSLDTSTQAWRENTAMTIEAEKRFKTTQSALKILENNVKDAGITIGSELLPQIAELAREGADWLRAHPGEIEDASRAIADGFRDAVMFAKGLDWEAIAGALQAGAGFAKGMVDIFMGMPPWMQQLLTVGFVANKFTGGAVMDAAGAILKASFKTMFITAGVVNVKGGLGGGVPGVPGTPGGGGMGLASKAFLVGEAIGLAMLVESVADDIGAKSLEQAQGIHGTLTESLAASPDMEALQIKLAGIDEGLARLPQDPIGRAIFQSSIDELQAMRLEVVTAINAQNATHHTDASSEGTSERVLIEAAARAGAAAASAEDEAREGNRIARQAAVPQRTVLTERQEAILAEQKRASQATWRSVESARAGIVGAVRALDLSVQVTPVTNVNVSMTARAVGTTARKVSAYTSSQITRRTSAGIY